MGKHNGTHLQRLLPETEAMIAQGRPRKDARSFACASRDGCHFAFPSAGAEGQGSAGCPRRSPQAGFGAGRKLPRPGAGEPSVYLKDSGFSRIIKTDIAWCGKAANVNQLRQEGAL